MSFIVRSEDGPIVWNIVEEEPEQNFDLRTARQRQDLCRKGLTILGLLELRLQVLKVSHQRGQTPLLGDNKRIFVADPLCPRDPIVDRQATGCVDLLTESVENCFKMPEFAIGEPRRSLRLLCRLRCFSRKPNLTAGGVLSVDRQDAQL